MKCKVCKGDKFTTKSSWTISTGFIKRRYICKKCGTRMISVEVPEEHLNKYYKLVDEMRIVISRFLGGKI